VYLLLTAEGIAWGMAQILTEIGILRAS